MPPIFASTTTMNTPFIPDGRIITISLRLNGDEKYSEKFKEPEGGGTHTHTHTYIQPLPIQLYGKINDIRFLSDVPGGLHVPKSGRDDRNFEHVV